MGISRVREKSKLNEQSFFSPKNPYPASKISKRILETFFYQDTPKESAAFLFQYARCAHIYRDPNVLLVLVLLVLLVLIPLKF